MNDTSNHPPRATGGRDQRLRDALRENLKRRKAQARGRAASPAPGDQSQTAAAAPEDSHDAE